MNQNESPYRKFRGTPPGSRWVSRFRRHFIGCYRELTGSPDDLSLLDWRDYHDPESRLVIGDYLLRGDLRLVKIGAAPVDVFDGGLVVSDSCRFYSDFRWCWQSELSYYVSRYGVRVPDEFLEWIRRRHFQRTGLWSELKIGLADLLE